MNQPHHHSVLLQSVLTLLNPQPGQSYFDGTAGYGGHAAKILDRLGHHGSIVLVDRDERAVQSLRQHFGRRVEIRQQTFAAAAQELLAAGRTFDLALLDLGVASPQIDEAERGFSFRLEGPLDMRMDQRQHLTAAQVVNTYPETELVRVLSEYGEERRARAVARQIRAQRPFHTTTELATVVRRAVGYAKHGGHIDSATRTFQALRIEVNGELTGLRQGLPLVIEMLAPGGRLAVISFHSLEDRIVKQTFHTLAQDCICPPQQPVCTCTHRATIRLLTRGAVKGENEVESNPRARSARLRAIEKLTPTPKEEP